MRPWTLYNLLAAIASLLILAGCTFLDHREGKQEKNVARNGAAITEESRALTTGIVDALSVAPTNPPTSLALDLARRDQSLEGLPLERIDVAGVLAQQAEALAALERRFNTQDKLRVEKAALEKELDDTRSRLVEMGKLYEQERNKSIVKRVWHWAVGTLGVAGAIAFFVFCPAIALPLFGRIIAWAINALPALASFFGVVGKKAFDGVVKGVSAARAKIGEQSPQNLEIVDASLKQAMDESDRKLVRHTRAVLNVA